MPVDGQFSIHDVGLEDVERCPVCSSLEHSELFSARDTLHNLPGEWSVRRCTVCGHGFTSPRPDRSSISLYYPDDYSPFNSPVADLKAGNWKTKIGQRLRAIFDPREVLLPPELPPGNALEVGCGTGRILVELSHRGWNVQGIEPSPVAVRDLRKNYGLRVILGNIDEVDYPSGSFNLVVALMVLEHLHDPLADIRRLASWIRPGGYLVGSVPNCASWEFRFFGSEWYALQVPTHLSHFSPRSLKLLLTKAGFSRIQIRGQRNVNNLMVHLGRALDHRHSRAARVFLDYPVHGPRALRLTAWPVATLLAAIGQAGRISFFAQKPSPAGR